MTWPSHANPRSMLVVPQQIELHALVGAIARSFSGADALGPVRVSQRSGRVYSPGIGPHAENAAVGLMLAQLGKLDGYSGVTMGQFLPEGVKNPDSLRGPRKPRIRPVALGRCRW